MSLIRHAAQLAAVRHRLFGFGILGKRSGSASAWSGRWRCRMFICSGGRVGLASGGDLVGQWGNVQGRLCLTLAAADAKIWGG
jgi:hypothetical protein